MKSAQPFGQLTRGKTARNRLRRVDTWLMLHEPGLLQRSSGDFANAWYIDLGFGDEPYTTLESAARLRKLNPKLQMMGVEIDKYRTEKAQSFADPLTVFRYGGFNLPLQAGETVRVIRAFNVLRQYDESQVKAAHKALTGQLLPGGLLIEGTSDPFGQIWAANIIRKRESGNAAPESTIEGVLFSTNFHSGFDPAMFQPVLPKNFIHHMLPGETIFKFFESWKQATRKNIALQTMGLRQWFTASAKTLQTFGYDLDLRHKYLRRGYLFWKWNS